VKMHGANHMTDKQYSERLQNYVHMFYNFEWEFRTVFLRKEVQDMDYEELLKEEKNRAKQFIDAYSDLGALTELNKLLEKLDNM